MSKKARSRILSFLMAFVMVFSLLPVSALASGDPIEVNVTMQQENWFVSPLLPGSAISVTPGIAEQYGYVNDPDLIAEDQVSVLDVLVAAHIEALGGDELLSECLEVNEVGSITKVMGESTMAFSFTVNGEQPHSGEWVPAYSAYLGYSCNQAAVEDGDIVDFFFFQDDMWLDYYTWFEQDGEKVSVISAQAGSEFEVELLGYFIGWYGYADEETKADMIGPLEDMQVGVLDTDTGEIIPMSGAVTDEDGKASVTISEPGTYVLSAVGDEWAPIISPYVTVKVTASAQKTGTAFVTVRNDKYEGEPRHTGEILPRAAVDIYEGDTVCDILIRAFDENGVSAGGLNVGLLTSVEGLQMAGDNFMSGWHLYIDGWYALDASFAAAATDLMDLQVLYSVDMGNDLGGWAYWTDDVDDTSVKSLTSGEGELSPQFEKSVYDYELTVPEDTAFITLNPVATNNYYQVRTSIGDVVYPRVAEIPVADGTVIKVICGDPSWPSVNSTEFGAPESTASEYTITVRTQELSRAVTISVEPADAVVSLYGADGKRVFPDEEGLFDGLTAGETYTYTVTKNGYIGVKDSFTYTAGMDLEISLDPVPESELNILDSEWPSFRGNGDNMGVVSSRTPITTEDASMLWQYKPTSYSNNQIIVDDYVFINSGTKIFKIDKNSGELAATADMLAAPSFNIVPMTYAEGMLFANINNGRIQAFNAETLESLWVSESLGGQCLSHIVYSDGYVYTGFWSSETANQSYVCIPVADEDPDNTQEIKTVSWKFTVPGGFYWVGGIVRGDTIVFGSDDGVSGSNNPSKLYSVNKITGELIDSVDTTGDLRSAVAYDAQSDRLYFTSKGGYVYSVKQNSDGTFAEGSLRSYKFDAGWEVTGTPAVHNGRLYIGTGKGFGTGKLVVMDAETMTPVYDTGTQLAGYPQGSPLLSTAYEAKTGKVYIYTTYNSNPGGIAMIEDSAGQTELVFTNLFTPEKKQYCLSSPIADSEGNIYYHNDSGYVFKIAAAPEDLPEKLITGLSLEFKEEPVEVTDNGDLTYEVSVGYAVPFIEVIPEITEGAEVTVNGESLTDGGATVSLAAGETTDTTIVATYKTKTETATLSVTRAALTEPVTLPELQSDWNSTRGNRRNMGVVAAETARNADEAELLWDIKFADGTWASPNTPVIVEDNLIFAAGTNIYKADKETGEILAQNAMVSSPSFNISSVTYGGGMVFTTVSSGRIQAFDADTLESLWVSEQLGGQSLSHIVYADGYVYTGFWAGEAKDNYYVCLSVTDEDPDDGLETKSVFWKHKALGGFYWSGGAVIGDYIVFGSDNGTSAKEDLSRLYSLNRFTGEVVDTCEGVIGDQRSSIAYDEATDALYFTSKAGYVCRVKLDAETGKFINDSLIVRQMNTGWEATGTPVVYGGVLFVGTGAGPGGGGKFVAANAETLEILDYVDLIAYPQGSPLLTTAYAESEGKLYLYITYNKNPGGLTVAEYDIAAKELSSSELFTPPAGRQNYCIDSVICDTDGTLYYHNDSTYMFAIGKINPEDLPEKLITGVKAERSGTNIALTPDGENKYKASVNYSYDSVDILASAIDGASVTVNGQAPVDGKVNVALAEGTATVITVTADYKIKTESVTVTITRGAAPTPPDVGEGQFGSKVGTVSVYMRNDTFPAGSFTDEIFSEPSFDLYSDDTMMTVVLRALKANGYSWTGTGGDGSAEDYKIAYLASIEKDGKSLGEFDGEAGSGWVGTLNDFFVNEGFQQFKPENGDEISVEYTQNLGEDVGGSWGDTNTALKSLDFSAGTLTPAFDSETNEYILTLPAGSTSVKVTPRAYNRNYLVKTFLNEKVTTNAEGSSFYKRTANIPVKAGDTLYIGVGEPAWPSMNNQYGQSGEYEATWYEVKINITGAPSGNTTIPGGTETIEDPDTPLGGLPDIDVVELPADIDGRTITVTVTEELAKELLDNAGENKEYFAEQTVVIAMPGTGGEDAAIYKTVIPAKELAEFKDNAIFICTPAGNIILPASLVNDLIAGEEELIITVEEGSLIVKATLGGVEVQPGDYGRSVRLEIPVSLSGGQNPDMAVMAKVAEDSVKIIGTSYFSSGFVVANVAETGRYDALYNEKAFTDTDGRWMDKAVLYMAAREIVSGVGESLYDPDRGITRAEFAALLVRTLEAMDIELEAAGQNFSDVESGKWYSEIVLKAREAGLVSGVGDNTFAPETTITRQDMFTMLCRAMEKYGLFDKFTKGEAAQFTDGAQIAEYAREAVDELTSRGLVSGKGDGTVAPGDASTRGECAQVLYNILSKH